MTTTYKQPGDTITWTNSTGSAVVSGEPVQVGFAQMGIALVDIASAATGSVALEGVHTLAKTTGAIALGGPVYWDATNDYCENAPAIDNTFIGFAFAAAGSSDTTIDVRLEEFCCEPPRIVSLAATGNETLTAGAFLGGDVTLLAPNTGAKTVNLPALATVPTGTKLRVKKTTADAHAITLDGASSETIGGSTTYASIDAANDTADFVVTGSTWQLVTSSIA